MQVNTLAGPQVIIQTIIIYAKEIYVGYFRNVIVWFIVVIYNLYEEYEHVTIVKICVANIWQSGSLVSDMVVICLIGYMVVELIDIDVFGVHSLKFVKSIV